MEVSNVNDVKIYNLSSGKSLPEWISDSKKRRLLKKDGDLRRRLELIQDFKMPSVSSCIKVSKDGQHIMATGVYKPRVKCYDVEQLALKFERCFDAEVVKFEFLSDDWTKVVFLQDDRNLEFHSQFGRYYRLRIPKFGHDLCYNSVNCDLYCVGASPDVYRLNLEQGKFMTPYTTDSSTLNACAVNPVYNLFVCGSEEGFVEAWDPRKDGRVGKVDCAASCLTVDSVNERFPSISKLCFKDGLNMAVGTSTGLILLYDIRAGKPYFVKDHLYGLPIKDIEFIPQLDLVVSMDSKIIKFWQQKNGESYTSIQTQTDLNDLCLVPDTGMLFVANEDKQILTFFIPSIGPAPKWCSFLDHLVEELEESNENTLYDDYKFVTTQELETLGLSHLIGTNLLRAHMHGFFMDIRLYRKAKSASNPFAYEEYKKKKIKEKLEAERGSRVNVESNLPKVNKELAKKLMGVDGRESAGKKGAEVSLLKDDRFGALFENPDFQVDEQSEEYKILQPLMAKLEKKKASKLAAADDDQNELAGLFEEVEEGKTRRVASDSDDFSGSSDDLEESEDEESAEESYSKRGKKEKSNKSEPKLYKLKEGKSLADLNSKAKKDESNVPLMERLRDTEASGVEDFSAVLGNRVMTYKPADPKKQQRQEKLKSHLQERKRIARSARAIKGKSFHKSA